MPFCVAEGCHNQSDNTTDVSYHLIRKASWVAAIGRKDVLPPSGRLCSEHFADDSYESTTNLKMELCPGLFPGTRNTRRRLKEHAVPTIFHHKDLPTPRVTSVERNERKEHLEVSNNQGITKSGNKKNKKTENNVILYFIF